jgi:ParB/RepB/Spo0J family partition protein
MPDTPLVAQQIPLGLIKPNPANRLVTPDMVDDMAASLGSVGLKNPVKMRPLPDGTFDLFSGHVRFAGAQKLGWETIAAYVMDITPEEAVEIAILDNRNKKQTWLDNYIDIEKLQAVHPKITNKELADRLNDGISVSAIKRGKRVLKCLNSASRALINQSIAKSRAAQAQNGQTLTSEDQDEAEGGQTLTSAPQVWELTENPVYTLTGLEDQESVFKALLVVIDRQMTAPQAQKLVEWVQAGNPPETFGTAPKTPKAPKPKPAPGPSPEALDKFAELAEQVGVAKGRGEDPAPAQEQLKAYRESLTTAVPTQSGNPTIPPHRQPGGVCPAQAEGRGHSQGGSKTRPCRKAAIPALLMGRWHNQIMSLSIVASAREVSEVHPRVCLRVRQTGLAQAPPIPAPLLQSHRQGSECPSITPIRATKGQAGVSLKTLRLWPSPFCIGSVYGLCQFDLLVGVC